MKKTYETLSIIGISSLVPLVTLISVAAPFALMPLIWAENIKKRNAQ